MTYHVVDTNLYGVACQRGPSTTRRHPEVRTFGTAGKSGGDDDEGDGYHVLSPVMSA
jgi:hypothetical protein